MKLFEMEVEENKNWLPYDGVVHYHGVILNNIEAENYFHALTEKIIWRNDEAVIFGKKIITKRKVAWYGDNSFKYTYSNTTKHALKWTKELRQLKVIVEKQTGEKFNSCLLNLYHSGLEGMAWHSDGEKDLKKNASIASLSFGAERKFAFKHKHTKEVVAFNLANGSLLEMKGTTQANWLHRLPPTKKVLMPRINLTFRTIVS